MKIVADMIKTLLLDFAGLELTNKTTENLISTINNVVSLVSVNEVRSANAAEDLADASLAIVTKQARSSSGTLVAESSVGKCKLSTAYALRSLQIEPNHQSRV